MRLCNQQLEMIHGWPSEFVKFSSCPKVYRSWYQAFGSTCECCKASFCSGVLIRVQWKNTRSLACKPCMSCLL